MALTFPSSHLAWLLVLIPSSILLAYVFCAGVLEEDKYAVLYVDRSDDDCSSPICADADKGAQKCYLSCTATACLGGVETGKNIKKKSHSDRISRFGNAKERKIGSDI